MIGSDRFDRGRSAASSRRRSRPTPAATGCGSSCATPRAPRRWAPRCGPASTPTRTPPSPPSRGVDDAVHGLGGRGAGPSRRSTARSSAPRRRRRGLARRLHLVLGARSATRRSRWAATTTTPSRRSARPGWRSRSCATTSTSTCCRCFADDEGVIRGPAGEGRVAAVARADVADVATVVLRDPAAHAGATYTLTGPEALTMAEVADRAGAVLGRVAALRGRDASTQAYASRAAAYDVEQWQLDAWVSTYTAIADGSCATVTDDVRRVAGHPPRTLEQALR